jgi:hypothetical protein
MFTTASLFLFHKTHAHVAAILGAVVAVIAVRRIQVAGAVANARFIGRSLKLDRGQAARIEFRKCCIRAVGVELTSGG